jgi:hypothetical protein
MSDINSDIQLGLPLTPKTTDKEMFAQMLVVYQSIQILQRELSAAKQRIAALEAYNTAHP